MTSDEEMEGYARECVRLAHIADDPLIRERLLQMAREWMAAAMHEAKLPASRGRVASADSDDSGRQSAKRSNFNFSFSPPAARRP